MFRINGKFVSFRAYALHAFRTAGWREIRPGVFVRP